MEEINSSSYWDSRFKENWEVCDGPKQSRFFSQIAIDNLPHWFVFHLRKDAMTMVDWGCAQADGTDVWAGYVDTNNLTGVDFSSVAIEQATRRYPAIRFVREDWLHDDGDQYQSYDVVFSSNTLEHFHKPYDVLKSISKRARKAVALALPYRELDRHSEHFFTFLAENIPVALPNGFRLVWARVVDCRVVPDTLWKGDQIILLYADPVWTDGLGLTLNDCQLQQEDAGSEIGLLKAAVSERDWKGISLSQELAGRDSQIASFTQTLLERDQQIANLSQKLVEIDRQMANLNQIIAGRDGQIASLNQTLIGRDQQIASLNQMLAVRDGQIASLNQTLAGRDGQIASLNETVATRDGLVDSLSQALAGRDGQIANLNQALAVRDGQISSLNRALAEHDGPLASLHQTLVEREERIAGLDRTLAERDAQINSLNRQRALWQSERHEMMRLSDWAKKMDSNPLAYGLKKYLRSLTVTTYRLLPLGEAAKQRVKRSVKNALKALRSPSLQSEDSAFVMENEGQEKNFPIVESYGSRLLATTRDAPMQERDTFVFSVIDWHFRIQRPQHLARSLAKTGKRVFFFSNHFVDSDSPGYVLERIDPELELYQVKLHVSGAPAIYFAPPTAEALGMLEKGVAKLMMDFTAVSILSLVQHAYWYPLASRLPNTLRVYDCMDHHEGFGNVPEALIEIEKNMLRDSDLVVATSTWLDQFARGYNNNVAVIRNAGEYAHFSEPPEERYCDPAGRKIIGYYGAIAEWFDLNLIRAVALANPDALVLLVGNDTIEASKILEDLPNVIFAGEVPYVRLPYYLYAFDVCLLPFQVIPLTLATNPVKVYEYLASGRPVVSVDLPEMSQFGDLVYCAGNANDFVALVTKCLVQPEISSVQERRRIFASEQTWDHRISMLEQAIAKIPLPRISVVVLTYNNLDLTKACLDSVVRWSDYPNIEIIVVDNASTDGSQAWLDEFKARYPWVRLIFNKENLGFAAGNNVGLKAATGDYLVLLNNDTVVTPGWLLTLWRHLQADPGIGLIGPVTNNIGNEAKIDIEYSTTMEMLPLAFSHTACHMGRHIPLPTAAFFCVMLSRDVFERVGLLDENFGRGFFEDDDYCRRVEQLGLRVACAEDVFVHHHLSASFNKLKSAEKEALFEQNRAYYESKWGLWQPHRYRA